jgi:pilus assembly protein CpaB
MSRNFGGVNPVRQSRMKALIIAGLALVVLIMLMLLLVSGGKKAPTQQAIVIQNDADVPMVDVLVPVKEITPGIPLDPAMFRKESRPKVGIDHRALKDFEEIKAMYARTLIVSGQPILRDYITNVRPTSDVTASIPEGFRAVTIKVDSRTAVEGFARPGAKVDVVWATTQRGEPVVNVIVQNAKVLSLNNTTQSGDANGNQQPQTAAPTTVTLLVSAEDAAKIQLASTTGSLSLQLRGDTDSGKGGTFSSITMSDLRGDRPAAAGEEKSIGTLTMGGQKYNVSPDGKLKLAGGTAESK